MSMAEADLIHTLCEFLRSLFSHHHSVNKDYCFRTVRNKIFTLILIDGKR